MQIIREYVLLTNTATSLASESLRFTPTLRICKVVLRDERLDVWLGSYVARGLSATPSLGAPNSALHQ